jgi:hypothetical protein
MACVQCSYSSGSKADQMARQRNGVTVQLEADNVFGEKRQ